MNLYSIPPFLTLCCFVGLAVLTILRGRRTKINFLFFIICLLGSFLYIDILLAFNLKSAETVLLISRIDHVFLVYLFPVYLDFFHAYLNISKRKWLVKVAYAYAFMLMCLTQTSLYIVAVQKHFFGYYAKAGVLFPLFGAASGFVTIYTLTLLFQAIRAGKNNARINSLKYVFAGFGIMGLINALSVLPLHGYSVYPPGNFSFIPLIVFAVGLFKHDLLDMGILIKKSLVYSILTALLTCAYALIIIAANTAFKEFKFSDSIYFPMLLFLLIALVFGPLKSKIQTMVDRLFYKGKYDYQKTIKRVSRMIVSMLDYNEITKQLTDTIIDAMKVEHCALFLANASQADFMIFSARGSDNLPKCSQSIPAESHLVQYMKIHLQPVLRKNLQQYRSDDETARVILDMDALEAEIALPMIFKESLSGFLVLGEKLSGDLFTTEDLDLLETLASQSALAVENARVYTEIQDLNKDLEKKVTARTRDLQEALVEKERTQEQLIHSESLAAIGQLVAGVAHELNNPLASVTSLVQATIEDLTYWNKHVPPDEDLIDDLKFADKELARAKSIVASLLSLSRQTQTYSENVNLNTVVKDALRILFNQHKHYDLDIVENYDQDLPDINGNFSNLGQVAMNLIQNAIQAADNHKSTIFLETFFEKNTGQAVFICTDTGPGIPESIRQDIFKPFFTTKAVGKGTGLGLYLCHEIIRKHGGTLTLENADAKGAKFVVRLPVDT